MISSEKSNLARNARLLDWFVHRFYGPKVSREHLYKKEFKLLSDTELVVSFLREVVTAESGLYFEADSTVFSEIKSKIEYFLNIHKKNDSRTKRPQSFLVFNHQENSFMIEVIYSEMFFGSPIENVLRFCYTNGAVLTQSKIGGTMFSQTRAVREERYVIKIVGLIKQTFKHSLVER